MREESSRIEPDLKARFSQVRKMRAKQENTKEV